VGGARSPTGCAQNAARDYILSALSDAANVKVRDGLLDIKLKTGTTPQGYELFTEVTKALEQIS